MIGAYTNEQVGIVSPGARDKWGEPSPATVVTVRARVQWRTRLVRDASGEETISRAMVLLPTQPASTDRIRIGGVDYPILSVSRRAAWATSHYEVSIA